MTDYDFLYSKFQFKGNEIESLKKLHEFSKKYDEFTERFVFTTTITIKSEVRDINQEGDDVKLV